MVCAKCGNKGHPAHWCNSKKKKKDEKKALAASTTSSQGNSSSQGSLAERIMKNVRFAANA
jgi:hypothetical protein